MGPSTGYSWGNTSQWSSLSTTPASNTDSNTSMNTNNSNNTPINSNYSAPVPNPETRRDMIERLYKTILGREADTAGINFYLFNSNISEAQIAKEMYESTEHRDILLKAKDVREMILKLQENIQKTRDLERKLQSTEDLCKNYKNLLDQERQMISELQGVSQSYPIEPEFTNYEPQPNNQQQVDYSNEYGTHLEDPFAEENKPGVFQKIKGIFKKNK